MGWGLCTPSHFKLAQHMVRYCHVNGPTLLKTTFYADRFFYSFNASDGSKGTTTGRVVLHRSIMVHHGFRGMEVRHARKSNIDYAKQRHTPHCSLLDKLINTESSNMRFSWLPC